VLCEIGKAVETFGDVFAVVKDLIIEVFCVVVCSAWRLRCTSNCPAGSTAGSAFQVALDSVMLQRWPRACCWRLWQDTAQDGIAIPSLLDHPSLVAGIQRSGYAVILVVVGHTRRSVFISSFKDSTLARKTFAPTTALIHKLPSLCLNCLQSLTEVAGSTSVRAGLLLGLMQSESEPGDFCL
jgi:hypothetical protein